MYKPSGNAASPQPVPAFQLVLLALSIYILGALAAETFIALPPAASHLLQFTDNLVCLIFLWDFFRGFWRAPDRMKYFAGHWIDLVSSIPTVDALRAGRMVRIIQTIRILRMLRATQRITEMIRAARPQGVLGTLATCWGLLVLSSAIGILLAEQDPSSNIKSAGDAIWWSVTTMTTVGYGDKYPVTGEGRIVAMVLMTTGVGLFGAFSAAIAAFLLGHQGHTRQMDELARDLRRIEARLDALALSRQDASREAESQRTQTTGP